MSIVTVSTKRNRVYQRKFDHNEARELRAQGWTYTELADRYGVTATAVARVCDKRIRQRMNVNTRKWWASSCPDCGASQTTLGRRCVICAGKARATSVRPDTLRCFRCGEWKPDEDFPHDRSGKIARRLRHSLCRACQTIARREYRQRNREASNAYDRECKRRKKAAA